MLVCCFHYNTHSSDLIIAVFIVLYFLYRQGNGCNLLSEGWHTNFGSDSISSISAVDFGAIAMRGTIAMREAMGMAMWGTMGVAVGVMIGIDHRQRNQRQNECLEIKVES